MQEGMTAFGGIAPTYRIALLDKPTIIWDFHSLMLGIQMMFSFMLTDSKNPIRLCRHCTKAFVASRPSAVFCSPQCKNKHNVYKTERETKVKNRKGMDMNEEYGLTPYETREILFYKTDNGEVRVEILLYQENLWLTQQRWQNYLKCKRRLFQNI